MLTCIYSEIYLIWTLEIFKPLFVWERIRCRPTYSCKLWKLQSESLDQHPRGMRNWVILQFGPALGLGNHTFANSPSHLSAPLPLDVDLMAQNEVYNLHGEVGLHLICSPFLITWQFYIISHNKWYYVGIFRLGDDI